MGFLDNSGDIILDAVLTDAGRARLAKGDGSFRITKFALGDDEINYSLYNYEAPNGQKDLQVLNTPIFEAFSNNMASLNSRLISISRTDLTHLPVLKINNKAGSNYQFTPITKLVQNGFIFAVDQDTENFLSDPNLYYDGDPFSMTGMLKGYNTSNSNLIRIDQGIDNKSVPPTNTIGDLLETQYTIEVDNRMIIPLTPSNAVFSYSYLDDDNIASYFVAWEDDTKIVENNQSTSDQDSTQVIAGPRGTYISFKLKSSIDVSSTSYLFEKLGSSITDKFILNGNPITTGNVVKKIATSIRITGLNLGSSIDIPVVLIKYYKS